MDVRGIRERRGACRRSGAATNGELINNAVAGTVFVGYGNVLAIPLDAPAAVIVSSIVMFGERAQTIRQLC